MTAHHHPHYHPCCHTLLRYASGSLSPTMRLFIATHLTLCPGCRQELQTYESQAGLGLESLPPEELDARCLEHLLTKINESEPVACIDVTVPLCESPAYRYPEPLQSIAGLWGETIPWESSNGIQHWILPDTVATRCVLYKISDRQPVRLMNLDEGSMILILYGTIESSATRYECGDIILSNNRTGTTTCETLCLVATPTRHDKPNWLQRLLSFMTGHT